jgi:tetratricopeptide (TPR) repeat protein
MLKLLAAGLLALSPLFALAAPFTPSSDADIVERLPGGAGDPAARRVDSLRKQLAARPGDVNLRIEIARRYFDLAMAQGDPRYVGYAAAALAPLETTAPDSADYWLARGLIQQYSHDFAGALKSLRKASELDPDAYEPVSWRSAIHMVQANYKDALGECTRMLPLAHPLYAQGCTAYVTAATGHLKEAYATLSKQFTQAGDIPSELALWTRTRLAEMADRLQQFDQAEKHFQAALALGITDQFLLAAYSDFLLQQQRPREVIKLLADWERSDVLLLRLALAGKAVNDARAKSWADQLRERFEAAARRGDRLHEQEAARFALDIEGNPRKALESAAQNYATQKEPRDAEILLRSAAAANDAKAARPALEWLKASGYEDPALGQLASRLAGDRK